MWWEWKETKDVQDTEARSQALLHFDYLEPEEQE